METNENSNEENKPMTRIQRMLVAQERSNKARNVDPAFVKKVNNLFRSPIIVTPISFTQPPNQNLEAPPKQTQLEQEIQELGDWITIKTIFNTGSIGD